MAAGSACAGWDTVHAGADIAAIQVHKLFTVLVGFATVAACLGGAGAFAL